MAALCIHENQVAGANAIVEAFNVPNCCWVSATAPMQSGKSDTYMMVGAELLRLEKVSSVVVISANADVALRKQTKNTTPFWRAYRKYLISNVNLGAEEAADDVDDMKEKFSVVWGTDLKKEEEIHQGALIIWDESHYGQSRGQLVDSWFKLQGISPDGSGCANGNLVLSVSATPFSERIDIVKYSQIKQLVNLEPGPDYFGVSNMMEKGVILPFNEDDLPSMLDELVPLRADGRNAAIIRVSKYVLERRIMSLCEEKGIQCIEMNSASDVKDINKILSSTVEPIVVLLKGMLRMGKQIERKYRLLWCLETAVNANHDTTLQSLLGRCCGYPTSGSGPDIRIYLPPKQIHNLKTWREDKTGKAMNVKSVGKPQRNSKVGGYATVPYKMEITVKTTETRAVMLEGAILHLSNRFTDEENNNNVEMENLRKVLLDRLGNTNNQDDARVEFLDLTQPTYLGLAERLECSYKNNERFVAPKSSCGCTLGQVRVWYAGTFSGSIQVYVQYKTEIAPENDESPMTFGNTTGREIFAHKHEDGSESQQNGSAHFRIGPKTADDVEAMKTAIEDIIVWAIELRSEHVTPPTEITSDCNGYTFSGIVVSPAVDAALNPCGAIYEHIKTNQHRILVLVPAKGRPPKKLPVGYKRLSAIQWWGAKN